MANTKTQKSYAEKLKDPRWQKMRLEIMQRDGFKCVKCKSETESLQVHHKKYFKGREPWNYDSIYLETLCYKCHKGEHTDNRIAPEKEWEGLIKRELSPRQNRIYRLQELLKQDLNDDFQVSVLTQLIYLRKKEVVVYG